MAQVWLCTAGSAGALAEQVPHPDHGYMAPALSREGEGEHPWRPRDQGGRSPLPSPPPRPLSRRERGDWSRQPAVPPCGEGRGTCWSSSHSRAPRRLAPLGGMCCVNSAIKSSGERIWKFRFVPAGRPSPGCGSGRPAKPAKAGNSLRDALHHLPALRQRGQKHPPMGFVRTRTIEDHHDAPVAAGANQPRSPVSS